MQMRTSAVVIPVLMALLVVSVLGTACGRRAKEEARVPPPGPVQVAENEAREGQESTPAANEANATQESTAAAVELTDDSFKRQVIDSGKPALVDFWAVWCGPCRQQAPIIESIAAKYGDRILVGKVDVDKCEATGNKYNVEAIPTLILFKGGREMKRFVGLTQEEDIAEAIENNLLK